jgi:uncharacterized protein with FMN-binding domain
MKRALLIAGGTVGGLGAVLAITPPQLSGTSAINIAGGAALGSVGGTASASSSPSAKAVATQAVATQTAATKTSKPVATKKATSKATTQATTKAVASATASTTASASATATPTHSATASATASATPTATATPTHSATATATPTHSATPTPAAVTKSGTFTGPAIFVNYGTVQVKITVTNGRITDAVAVQAPSGRNDRYTQMAVPILKQQTLTAQSANIKGASGASYTSYGWFKSLQGALANAGL